MFSIFYLNYSDGAEVVPATTEAATDKLRVTMVCWNLNDSMVITAVSDFSLKVWESHTGKLRQILQVLFLLFINFFSFKFGKLIY